jgi:hypothetical protein
MEKETKIHNIGGQQVSEEDLTKEQRHHKDHVISLRNKIAKLQFEIDDLLPSLRWHEDTLIAETKKQADETLSDTNQKDGEL